MIAVTQPPTGVALELAAQPPAVDFPTFLRLVCVFCVREPVKMSADDTRAATTRGRTRWVRLDISQRGFVFGSHAWRLLRRAALHRHDLV
jgi:hypothetical protein